MASGRRASRSARAAQAYNGAVRGQVADIQRARMLSAMFDVASEHGAANVSVAHVVQRSGVSRRTFYEVFTDREDCFLAAFEEALAFACERVLPAYATEKKWCERIRAGLTALLSFLDEEPTVGRLLIVESLSGGPQTLARRELALARLAGVLDEGRAQSVSGASLPSLTAEGLVGGVLAVIQTRLQSGWREASRSRTQGVKSALPTNDRVRRDAPPILTLTNQFMGMIVLPYLGPAAARRELDRPIEAHASEHRDARRLPDPFKAAGMRLTYRTVRVLLAVAERPGASNRQLGEIAGISDQGQISKLLTRLQRLGSIENTGMAPGQGGPNEWSLTGSGHQLVRSLVSTGSSKWGGEPAWLTHTTNTPLREEHTGCSH